MKIPIAEHSWADASSRAHEHWLSVYARRRRRDIDVGPIAQRQRGVRAQRSPAYTVLRAFRVRFDQIFEANVLRLGLPTVVPQHETSPAPHAVLEDER